MKLFILLSTNNAFSSECVGNDFSDHYYNRRNEACTIDDIAYFCNRYEDNNCPTWDSISRYGYKKFKCKNKNQVYYQAYDDSESEFLSLYNFDKNKNLIGYLFKLTEGGSYCCDEQEAFYLQYGAYYDCDRIPLDSPPPDTGTDDKAETCGCVNAAPASALALLPLLLLGRRRAATPPRR